MSCRLPGLWLPISVNVPPCDFTSEELVWLFDLSQLTKYGCRPVIKFIYEIRKLCLADGKQTILLIKEPLLSLEAIVLVLSTFFLAGGVHQLYPCLSALSVLL